MDSGRGEAQEAATLYKDLQATKECWGIAHQLAIQHQLVSPENTHARVKLCKLSSLCLCIWKCLHACVCVLCECVYKNNKKRP